jgi:DNA-binding MarR family transcriptional regulator
MSTARFTAPEIDRLVLSANAGVGQLHGERLRGIAAELGLDGVAPLPTNVAPFLQAGVLTEQIATLRMRYADPVMVTGHLAGLVEKGLAVRREDDSYAATERMVPLLDAIAEAQASVVSPVWGPHPELMATVSDHAARVGAAAPADHLVAVAHRQIAEPEDPAARLLRRLITLRYVRQHDHAAAWLGRHLTATEMPVFTALWQDEAVEADRPGLASLVERGYAEADPVRLTARGRRVREAIEDDTNAFAQRSFDVLGEEAGAELVDGLRRLPSATT